MIFGLEVAREELERRIDRRAREMFERGVEEEVRRASNGPISMTAREVHGLQEIAELPRERALEALIVSTRRYAAYQRKWMRRIPRIVTLDAARPAGEVAGEIAAHAGLRA